MPMRKVLRIGTALLVVLLIAGAAFGWLSYRWLHTQIPDLRAAVTYEMPRGASLRSVARDLHQRGVIDRPEIWVAAARLTGKAGALKAGEYRLEPGLTPIGLLQVLSSGQVILHA